MADSVELPDSDADSSDSDAEPEFASESITTFFWPYAEPEFASEMEIVVQQDAVHNYVLLADGDNIVEDVLVEILGRDRAGRAPEPRLFFNDLELQKEKTLAECGIELGSVLHLKCTPRVLVHTDENRNSSRNLGWRSLLIPHKGWGDQIFKLFRNSNSNRILRWRSLLIPHKGWGDQIFKLFSPAKKAKREDADSGSPVRPNGDGEMKIFVQSEYYGNYVLEVEDSNTVQDVLITVVPISRLKSRPKPKLYFNGHLLEMEKSLADCGIQDGSILHLECTDWVFRTGTIELPNGIPNRKKITITDRPLAIWEKEHDKILLGLLVKQSRNRRRKILDFESNSWRAIVAKFNEATCLKYEEKHLHQRFNFYEFEYGIVSKIRHHPKFRWDHQRQVVIATDAYWDEYMKENHTARPYRRRAVPYIDLLEILFANREV